MFAASMGDVGTGAGLAAVVVALIAAVAIMSKQKISKQTLELWKEEAGALRTRLATVELENHDYKKELDATKARVNQVEQANKVLSDMVSGTAAVQELSAKLDDRGLKVLEVFNKIAEKLEVPV